MKKTTRLKEMINSLELEFLMEGHNGLSAKIVEEAGFNGIWASGLSMSAALGVRDNNEASWTQILEVAEFMADATKVPILIDGDTGYGNFNNMRRVVKKLEQRGVAGICIEDKIFPKTNSFLRSEAQPLADIDEFSGKIKAGKDAQTDDDFVIVARVEAFIAGWGLAEALNRAEAYRQAGADAVLIHSKRADPEEVFSFMAEWGNRLPVVIVPTKFYSTPTDQFRKQGISIAIWANHLMRGAVKKMQEVAGQIYSEQNLMSVEDTVVPVTEVFRLQGDNELKEAEKRYLVSNKLKHSAIILAATRGSALQELTLEKPKAMLKIGNQSILEQSVTKLNDVGIKEIKVVTGYKEAAIDIQSITKINNAKHESTGELHSLELAIRDQSDTTVVLFGDILFKKYILNLILNDDADIVIVVDNAIAPNTSANSKERFDMVVSDSTNKDDVNNLTEEAIYLKSALSTLDKTSDQFDGEFIGMFKLSPTGLKICQDYLQSHKHETSFKNKSTITMLNDLAQNGAKVKIQTIHGHWADINTLVDLTKASQF